MPSSLLHTLLTHPPHTLPSSPSTLPSTTQVIAIICALVGTVVLALPIAVVGVTFDDEWVKQAKTNRFAAVSTVQEYNMLTRNGTRPVPDVAAVLKTDPQQRRSGSKGGLGIATEPDLGRGPGMDTGPGGKQA